MAVAVLRWKGSVSGPTAVGPAQQQPSANVLRPSKPPNGFKAAAPTASAPVLHTEGESKLLPPCGQPDDAAAAKNRHRFSALAERGRGAQRVLSDVRILGHAVELGGRPVVPAHAARHLRAPPAPHAPHCNLDPVLLAAQKPEQCYSICSCCHSGARVSLTQ